MGTRKCALASEIQQAPVCGTQREESIMSTATSQKPRHPSTDVPDEFEPDALPVEPDEGLTPTHIPDDPELDRVVNPEN